MSVQYYFLNAMHLDINTGKSDHGHGNRLSGPGREKLVLNGPIGHERDK